MQEICSSGGRAAARECDLSQPDNIMSLFQKRGGRIPPEPPRAGGSCRNWNSDPAHHSGWPAGNTDIADGPPACPSGSQLSAGARLRLLQLLL